MAFEGDWYIFDEYKGQPFIIFSTFDTSFLCFLIVPRRVVFSAFSLSAKFVLEKFLSIVTLYPISRTVASNINRHLLVNRFPVS